MGLPLLGPDLELYKRRFEARTHENDATSDLYAPIEELVRDVNQMPEDRFVEEVDAARSTSRSS